MISRRSFLTAVGAAAATAIVIDPTRAWALVHLDGKYGNQWFTNIEGDHLRDILPLVVKDAEKVLPRGAAYELWAAEPGSAGTVDPFEEWRYVGWRSCPDARESREPAWLQRDPDLFEPARWNPKVKIFARLYA